MTDLGKVWYDSTNNQGKEKALMKKFSAMMAMEMCMCMCRMDMRCCVLNSMGFHKNG